jgi:hypothetical protein
MPLTSILLFLQTPIAPERRKKSGKPGATGKLHDARMFTSAESEEEGTS